MSEFFQILYYLYYKSYFGGMILVIDLLPLQLTQAGRVHILQHGCFDFNGAFSKLENGMKMYCGLQCRRDIHDDVIKWKNFLRYWRFVRGIRRSPVNSPHKGQWRGALMFSVICAWNNHWVNNREAGYLRRHRDHYDVTVMASVDLGIISFDNAPSQNINENWWSYTRTRFKEICMIPNNAE